MLMTQLRRASRSLWNLKKHILLRNDPEEQGKTSFLLKKPLEFTIIMIDEVFKPCMADSIFWKFMESGFSELYQLEIKIETCNFIFVQDIKDILGDINMQNVTIKNIQCGYYRAYRSKCSPSVRLYTLQNLTNLFGQELETREFGGCKYFVTPKMFAYGADCLVFKIDEDGELDSCDDYPILGLCDFNIYCNFAMRELSVTNFLILIDGVTIGQICERIIPSNLNLIMPGDNVKYECDALMRISEKLKDWQQDAQKYPSRLTEICLKLESYFYNRLIEAEKYLVMGLNPLLQRCKEKGLKLTLKNCKLDVSKHSVWANLGFLVFGNEALVMDNLKLDFIKGFTTEEDCILFNLKHIYMKGQIISILSIDNNGINRSILEPGTIIIPRDKIYKANAILRKILQKDLKSLPEETLTVFIKCSAYKLAKGLLNRVCYLHKDTKISLELTCQEIEDYRNLNRVNLSKCFGVLKRKNLRSLIISENIETSEMLGRLVSCLETQTNLETLELMIEGELIEGKVVKPMKKLFRVLETLPCLNSIDISIEQKYNSVYHNLVKLIKKLIKTKVGADIEIEIGCATYLDRFSWFKQKLK
ncbi:unnamed protein product [Moneuplotes crassus]|uniref:Uncharacterized protein n=1 Tax=Euplotes crassus TaxID=5936 RepID=A0AAD1UHM9_EUPCR|nr:unnamed protein product [Moneuplotes crassus]